MVTPPIRIADIHVQGIYHEQAALSLINNYYLINLVNYYYFTTSLHIFVLVPGKMPPGKKPPGKMPPRKLPPGNKPPKKIAPRKNAPQENCFTRFLLLLTLSYSSSFSNFL